VRPRDANDQWQWMKWTMELLFSLTMTMEEIPSKTRIERLSTYQYTVNNFLSSSLGYYIVEYALNYYGIQFLRLQSHHHGAFHCRLLCLPFNKKVSWAYREWVGRRQTHRKRADGQTLLITANLRKLAATSGNFLYREYFSILETKYRLY
jgi:hypothetical protein